MKESSAKSGGRKVTYCQLMQTEYVPGGGSRQRLVQSLGRADRLDLDALRRMAARVTAGETAVLTPELLAVLPESREYGPVSLLLQALDSLDLPRCWREQCRRSRFSPAAAGALTALTAYYLLSYQRGTPFFQWLGQCHVPGAEAVTRPALREALLLLREDRCIHPGLESRAERAFAGEEWGFAYAVPCQYDFLPEDRPADALFLLSGEDVPLCCRLWERTAPGEMAALAARSVLLTRDPGLLLRQGLTADRCRFVCAASPGELAAFGDGDGAFAAFLREEGEFLPFREYGYRERAFGPVRAVILRSSSGPAAALSQWHREPRELILTNTALPVERVLEKFLMLDKVLDILHPVYLTEDLQFLREELGAGELPELLSRMQLLQLFLCLYLGRRLGRCHTTLDDALPALAGIRCVPLRWQGGSVLLTTPPDGRQQEILGAV